MTISQSAAGPAWARMWLQLQRRFAKIAPGLARRFQYSRSDRWQHQRLPTGVRLSSKSIRR